jgi:5-phospho-D-xylono-1,4-lactonase
MTIIRTVLGDIPSDDLGVTYAHEHLWWQPPLEFSDADPDLGLTSLAAARKELNFFRKAGGQALVEMTTIEVGRSPDTLRSLSEETGVHIIAATGHNVGKYSDPFVAEMGIDEVAQWMIRDLTEGMGGTEIRAGVLKCSTSLEHATQGERKVIRAAGVAYKETGAPVSTHTQAGSYALEQIELLRKAGIPPKRVLVGHLDRRLDWEYHRAIARTGVYLGFDQIGKEKYAPDSARIAMIQRLIDAGHQKQILLSGDLARKSNWPAYGFGYGPGLTHLLWAFVPRLLRVGISEEGVQTLLIENPARFLAFGTGREQEHE